MKKRSEEEIAEIVKNFGHVMRIALEAQNLPEEVRTELIGQALDAIERKRRESRPRVN